MPRANAKAAPPAVAPERRGRGRPAAERREPLDTLQARLPSALASYLKIAATVPAGPGKAPPKTALALHELVMTKFLAEKPWRRGLPWREGKAVAAYDAQGASEPTGWSQVNIALPESLADKARIGAAREGRSIASLCLTAYDWWARYVCPPAGAPPEVELAPRANGKADGPIGVAPITDPKLFAALMEALGRPVPPRDADPRRPAVAGTLAALGGLLDAMAPAPLRLSAAGHDALLLAAEAAGLALPDPAAVELTLSDAQTAGALKALGLPASLKGAAATAALAARCEEIGAVEANLRSIVQAAASGQAKKAGAKPAKRPAAAKRQVVAR